MDRWAMAVLTTMLATVGVLVAVPGAAPAAPAVHDHYGEPARAVAAEIGCRGFRRSGPGELHDHAGVCRLRGSRVRVITFSGRSQQQDWSAVARHRLPASHWWADAPGAVVTARDGSRAVARVAARRLPGRVVHG